MPKLRMLLKQRIPYPKVLPRKEDRHGRTTIVAKDKVHPESNFDDFNLEDAFVTTKKPLPSRKPPPSDLDDPKPGPPANPRDTDNPKQGPPANPKDTGNLDDSDLYDGSLPKGRGDGSGSNVSEGAIAGIVSAVFATVIGAVSSFIAYQKKKLCFKQSADEENVNMESHRGAQSEPPGKRRI
ncbi:PREDICTED: CD99 antigen [Charadrius vociferus]|uniref:CD99 antigen n=1 Tax=Charadrius vociferus TaxID=50402 RepID=UPI000521B4E8|nr:PREDICTED: CD99 antigen [Charadrius vociferus]